MKQAVLKYLKHLLLTISFGTPIFILGGLFIGGNFIKYNRNKLVDQLNHEGPYIFYESDSLYSINYINGSFEEGFDLETTTQNYIEEKEISIHYNLDSSSFTTTLNLSALEVPHSIYEDGEKILAISDLESNYATLRNFLINASVIDKNLQWTFGKGHLVLVGDFIDRSYFSTQILWFIYKLEQEAKVQGGRVHYILGNHEIMNMQGDHRYAKSKYNLVSTILNKKQFELYDSLSFIGQWLHSKNTVEKINGYLFTHGGIHPSVAESFSIDEMNQLIRKNYNQAYYPKKENDSNLNKLLSSKSAPFWYRGYFKNNLRQKEINQICALLDVHSIVVGHTIQSGIKPIYEGRIIGIDVKHPQDYYDYWPKPKSEALFIDHNEIFKVLEDGSIKKLSLKN